MKEDSTNKNLMLQKDEELPDVIYLLKDGNKVIKFDIVNLSDPTAKTSFSEINAETINPAYSGQGLATKGLNLLSEQLFESGEAYALSLAIKQGNIAATKTADRAGYFKHDEETVRMMSKVKTSLTL